MLYWPYKKKKKVRFFPRIFPWMLNLRTNQMLVPIISTLFSYNEVLVSKITLLNFYIDRKKMNEYRLSSAVIMSSLWLKVWTWCSLLLIMLTLIIDISFSQFSPLQCTASWLGRLIFLHHSQCLLHNMTLTEYFWSDE